METFFKMILDIEELRVLQEMYSISEFLYIYVPDDPVSSYEFLEESNKLRSEIGNFYESFEKIYIVYFFIVLVITNIFFYYTERVLEKNLFVWSVLLLI